MAYWPSQRSLPTGLINSCPSLYRIRLEYLAKTNDWRSLTFLHDLGGQHSRASSSTIKAKDFGQKAKDFSQGKVPPSRPKIWVNAKDHRQGQRLGAKDHHQRQGLGSPPSRPRTTIQAKNLICQGQGLGFCL